MMSCDTNSVSMESSKYGKIMEEKVSHVWEVKNISSLKPGQSVQSDPFSAGGYLFRVHFYPWGKDNATYISRSSCLSIENLSTETAEFVYGFEILCLSRLRLPCNLPSSSHKSKSSFHNRELYRMVTTALPGKQTFSINFEQGILEPYSSYVSRGDSIKIRTTLGVFVDAVAPPLDRIIFFEINEQGRCFYAEESVLRKRCPSLLPKDPQSTNVVLDDIDPDVFAGVVWYIYRKKLHRWDRYRIMPGWDRNPSSYYVKMRVAAGRFNFGDLRRICDAIHNHGPENDFVFCYPIDLAKQKLWRIVSKLWKQD